MKLHLGCGRKKWDGFVNCDLSGSDVDCDIRILPFGDDLADEIHAIHVVEHFFITEIQDVLAEWRRVLKPGGVLAIELPCWDKVVEHIRKGSPDNFTRWPLFGEPSTHKDGVPALHKWCYSTEEMRRLLDFCGYRNITLETPRYHQPTRDMRYVACK